MGNKGNPIKYGRKFAVKLLEWHSEHQRDLPWNKTKDPYKIWISEIILQQTRVEQGRPYYERFIKKFPTVKRLASAKEEEVLKLWQGLGYYSRARNLHKAAKQVLQDFDGVIPNTKESLITLSGVGEYTSSAIASFAFGLDHVAIDGNVIRVITRVFGVDEAVESAKVKTEIKEIAQTALPLGKSANFNRALMDFGSQVCTPKAPDCAFCPLRGMCFALLEDRVTSIPVKGKKVKKRNRYFHFLCLSNGTEKLFFERRTAKDIWQGLYQMPMIEKLDDQDLSDAEVFQQLNNLGLVTTKVSIEDKSLKKKHLLTHQNIFFQIHVVKGNWKDDKSPNWTSKRTARKLAFPKPMEEALAYWISSNK